MTISTSVDEIQYDGNDVALTFAYTWKVTDEAQLQVALINNTTGARTLQTITTHYTVTGVGNNAGGNVVFVTEPDSAYTVDIRRVVDYEQTADFRNQGQFYPENHEDAYDNLEMQIQQLARSVARCIRADDFDEAPDFELPNKVSRALKYMVFDSNGDIELAESLPSGTLSQTVIGKYLYGDDPGDGRTAAEIAAGVTPTNYQYEPGDVFRYGATGDGSTDDTVALQAALTLSRSHVMRLPPASVFYKITDELVFPGSNCQIQGSGYMSMIRQVTASAGGFARASGGSTLTNITMHDVYVGVSGSITGGTGFDLEGIANSKFYNCWAIADSALQGFLVGWRNHTTNDSTRYSILNQFFGCGARTAVSASARAWIASGASGTSSNSHRVFGGDWQADDGIGWYVPDNGGGAGGVSTQNYLSGATFEGDTDQAVQIDGSNSVSQGNYVCGNRFENGSGNDGVLMEAGSTGNYIAGNMYASGLTNKVVDNGEFNFIGEPSAEAGAIIAISRGSFRGVTPYTGALAVFEGVTAVETTGVLSGRVTGDTVSRILVKDNGRMEWGGGSGSADVALARMGSGFVGMDAGTFALKDGMTAPGATSGWAKLYVDTSDGDLKVIFGDGTIKTLVTDT